MPGLISARAFLTSCRTVRICLELFVSLSTRGFPGAGGFQEAGFASAKPGLRPALRSACAAVYSVLERSMARLSDEENAGKARKGFRWAGKSSNRSLEIRFFRMARNSGQLLRPCGCLRSCGLRSLSVMQRCRTCPVLLAKAGIMDHDFCISGLES